MFLNVLVVGCGLSGVLLSTALSRTRVAHKVVDSNAAFSGSAASSGILNPVMGRRRQVVPNLENLLPVAVRAYKKLEETLSTKIFSPAEIIDLHLSGEEAQLFAQRSVEFPQFLQPKSLVGAAQKLDTDWGATVTEGYLLHLSALLSKYKALLQREGMFWQRDFAASDVEDSGTQLHYAGEPFSHIILCNGIEALKTPLFHNLPLSANKGQALLIKTGADLPADAVYKWGSELTLMPLGKGHYWAGASFEWKFDSPDPTTTYRYKAEALLKRYLPYPFQVLEALSGMRTSSLDRRPVVGFHPKNPRWGVVNGMGTRGVLQAPYCAAQMATHLTGNAPFEKAYDLQRFKRLLG